MIVVVFLVVLVVGSTIVVQHNSCRHAIDIQKVERARKNMKTKSAQ